MDVQTAGQRLRERIELFEEQPITLSSVSGFLDDLQALACLMDPPVPRSLAVKTELERRLGLRVLET